MPSLASGTWRFSSHSLLLRPVPFHLGSTTRRSRPAWWSPTTQRGSTIFAAVATFGGNPDTLTAHCQRLADHGFLVRTTPTKMDGGCSRTQLEHMNEMRSSPTDRHSRTAKRPPRQLRLVDPGRTICAPSAPQRPYLAP